MNRFDPQQHVIVIRHKDTGKHDYVTLEELRSDIASLPSADISEPLLLMAEKINAIEIERVELKNEVASLRAIVNDILGVALQTERRAG